MGPDASHTDEKPVDPLTLLVYPDRGKGESTIYEDSGEGFGYEQGEFARRRISCETSEDRITVHLGEREGSFIPERKEVRLKLRGVTAAQGVLVDGEDHRLDQGADGALTVSLGEDAGAKTVEVIL
jgi:alpha-glucosidase